MTEFLKLSEIYKTLLKKDKEDLLTIIDNRMYSFNEDNYLSLYKPVKNEIWNILTYYASQNNTNIIDFLSKNISISSKNYSDSESTFLYSITNFVLQKVAQEILKEDI